MNRLFSSIVAVFVCSAAACAAEPKQPTGPVVDTKIGMEGVYYLRYEQEGLIPFAAS